jgi:hypothetical protein
MRLLLLLLQEGGKNKSYRSDCAIPVVHSHEVRLWSRLTLAVSVSLPTLELRYLLASVCLVCLASKTGSLGPLGCGSLANPWLPLQSAMLYSQPFGQPMCSHRCPAMSGFHSSKYSRYRWLALLKLERKASLLPPLPLLFPLASPAFPSLPFPSSNANRPCRACLS